MSKKKPARRRKATKLTHERPMGQEKISSTSKKASGNKLVSKTKNRVSSAITTRGKNVSRKRLQEAAKGPLAKELALRRKELDDECAKAEAVLNSHAKRIMARKGVVGVDVGFKMENCRYVRPLKYVIRIHVERKRTPRHPKARFDAPIEDIEVDVLERRYSNGAGGTCDGQPELLCFRNPMSGGVAITADDGESFGTLGMQVIKDGKPMYLTNDHVASIVGNEVLQPPMLGRNVPTDSARIVGHVSEFSRRDSELDCALITPTANRSFEGLVLSLPADVELRIADKLKRRDEGTEVFKAGAKTGSSHELIGIIDNVKARINVKGNSFSNQITIIGRDAGVFADEGDSGAVVVRKQEDGPDNAYELVGLVHAVTLDKQTAVACRFDDVAEELGFELP